MKNAVMHRYPALALLLCLCAALLFAVGACDRKEDAHAGCDHDHGGHKAPAPAPDPHAGCSHGPEGHGAGEGQAEGEMCKEHGVPEALCTRCNPSLIPVFKRSGDWCEEHTLPESQCKACNPDTSAVPSGGDCGTSACGDSACGSGDPLTAKCEHDVLIADCDHCRYEAGVVKLDPAVQTALLEKGKAKVEAVERTLKLTGETQFDPTRTVEIASTGSGVVVSVDRLLGERVDEGDVLAVIRSTELGEAKAAFIEAQARYELATKSFEREKALVEKGISGKVDYQSAQRDFTAAKGQLAAAEKRLRIFGLNEKEIEAARSGENGARFADLSLRAPRRGAIVRQSVTQGRFVETSESLYTVSDLSNLWVWCDLYERDLATLQNTLRRAGGVPVKIHVRAFRGRTFPGVIDLIGSEVDRQTRTIKVRVQVENRDGRLKPGMFATVEARIREGEQALLLPRSAVLADEGQAFVFEESAKNLWVRRNVRVADGGDGRVRVLEGLGANATVALKGAFALKSDILREKMGAGCAH
jgi:cobalt-zinc-cadmium efflux system membrane fusion protein